MPWREVTMESVRLEFVTLTGRPGANIKELCRRYGISRPTGYKWLERYRAQGAAGLSDRSRRPQRSPRRSGEKLETKVLALRARDEDWGGRKLRARLAQEWEGPLPSASTITEILRRHGKLATQADDYQPPATHRFEHEEPNLLWQMDYKGDFPLEDGRGTTCYPLTLLDDHSRFNLGLRVCLDQGEETAKAHLTSICRRYGVPWRLTCDNGPPWGSSSGSGITHLGVWLVRLGITVTHSRPRHPQTQGKLERFHRTLARELLRRTPMVTPEGTQAAFDRWRERYNEIRPHEALGLEPPISRYRASSRPFPETLLPVEYDRGENVRKVQAKGEISFRGQEYLVGRGLKGMSVALRESKEEGAWDVFFLHQWLRKIELRRKA